MVKLTILSRLQVYLLMWKHGHLIGTSTVYVPTAHITLQVGGPGGLLIYNQQFF